MLHCLCVYVCVCESKTERRRKMEWMWGSSHWVWTSPPSAGWACGSLSMAPDEGQMFTLAAVCSIRSFKAKRVTLSSLWVLFSVGSCIRVGVCQYSHLIPWQPAIFFLQHSTHFCCSRISNTSSSLPSFLYFRVWGLTMLKLFYHSLSNHKFYQVSIYAKCK